MHCEYCQIELSEEVGCYNHPPLCEDAKELLSHLDKFYCKQCYLEYAIRHQKVLVKQQDSFTLRALQLPICYLPIGTSMNRFIPVEEEKTLQKWKMLLFVTEQKMKEENK